MKFEFYTSVGGTAFWNGIVQGLASSGREAEVISVMDQGQYQRPKNFFTKLLQRWKLYAGMSLHTRRHLRQEVRQPTCRVATTNPFYLPGLVREHTPVRADLRVVNLVFDLYPEAIELSGRQLSPGYRQRLEALTRRTVQECDASIFLGSRLRDYALAKYGPAPQSAIIPVGADAQPFAASPPEILPHEYPVRLLYCGLLGRMHEIDTLVQLGQGEPVAGCEMKFHATGTGAKALRRGWFELGGPLGPTQWPEAMRSAQVGVVSVRHGAEKVVLPSKTYSALAAGQAILAICSKESDLASLVTGLDCGWVVEPGDVEGLRRRLHGITADREGLLAKQRNAFRAGQGPYACATVARQWVALAEKLFA